MQNKEFNVLLDIKESNSTTYIEVVQGDYGTNTFIINLTDNFNLINLTNLNVEVVFRKADGKTVVQDTNTGVSIEDAVNGKIKCTLLTNTIACPGRVTAEVRILEGNNILTSARFNFFVRASLTNDETVKSTNEFPILKKLTDDVKEANEEFPKIKEFFNTVRNEEETRVNQENTRTSNENSRQTSENQRVDNETSRNENEKGRITAENVRKDSENIRKSNEDIRDKSEQKRVNIFNTNENSRKNEFNEIKNEYSTLKKVMIDENNAANLQNQINNVNSQLTESVTRKVSNRKPTATDDETQNIKQGDIWIYENYINEEEYEFIAYQCMDNKARMAKWEKYVEKVTVPPKIYGVRIDENNSNPASAVTYTDDAVGMTAGSSAWDSMAIFKDIKPCVLKNGVVQYYLNPNDFTKKADGSAADITSGNDGDVMIEIPKTGFSITTNGNYIDVKVTDNPNNAAFKYYAHSRAAEGDRQKLYIGAYLGWNDGGKLRSLSGKTPTADQTIGTFRTQAQANGAGYDLVSFYPLTLLQCLYLIKYKNLDSQSALGRGYVDGNSTATNTGGTNQKGMFFGETTGKQQMKFLGIEDFWGNLRWWIDGLYSDNNRNIKTAFQNFNDTGSGYTDRGQGATSNIGNYMSKPQGTSQTGFIAKEVSGSASTYFCDYAYLAASSLPYFGGSWGVSSDAGAFYLHVLGSVSYLYSGLGGRLMYL